jgi:transcriptional regulator with XRE-family HTH domain
MPLSKYERKELLPYGAQSEIADELGLSEATVSLIMNDKTASITRETIERVRAAIARRIGRPVSELWDDLPAEVARAS